MLVCENDGFRPASPYSAKFHQRLIVAKGVETDSHVLGHVRVDEEQVAEQYSLGTECWTGRPVGTDVGQPLLLLLPRDASSSQQIVD